MTETAEGREVAEEYYWWYQLPPDLKDALEGRLRSQYYKDIMAESKGRRSKVDIEAAADLMAGVIRMFLDNPEMLRRTQATTEVEQKHLRELGSVKYVAAVRESLNSKPPIIRNSKKV